MAFARHGVPSIVFLPTDCVHSVAIAHPGCATVASSSKVLHVFAFTADVTPMPCTHCDMLHPRVKGGTPRWTFLDVLASRARTSERTFSLTLGMNKVQLLHLLTLRSSIGTQPQRDVRRLHRLPNHPHQVIAQSV